MKFQIAAAVLVIAGLATPAALAQLEPKSGVTLRALDKITGRATDIKVRVGRTVEFGRLEITPRACWQAPPEDTPESAAFLEITTKASQRRSLALGDEPAPASDSATGEPTETRLFSGWMYASSPGLNALEHPTYDVWVINCNT
jgi:hypothetical protein